MINVLVGWEATVVSWDFPPIRSLLYDQPSAFPAMWAGALRLFPLACLLLWPTIKSIPADWIDLARLDGSDTWNRIVIPETRETFRTAVFLIAALAMGEVAAAKIVNPPFFGVYILRLFDQMHYGSESSVAALALVQWFLSGILGVLWWITRTSSAKVDRASSRSQE
jgi:ABC-type Fe3+ transport system permease subunit